MRILLDESIPKKLGFLLPGHYVRTVQQMGWGGLLNGELLRVASVDFDVLVSGDQNIGYQQNPERLPMSVVALVALNNKLESFQPLVPALLTLIATLEPRRFYRIGVECT